MPVKGLDGADRHRLRHRPAASPTAASGTSTRTCGGSTATSSRAPFNERYCGDGDRAKCAAAVWAALEAIPGDPDALRADATKERIAFRPGLLPTTIRYTNRPSGIQQVITLRAATGPAEPGAGAGRCVYGRTCVTTPKTTQMAAARAAAVLAHAALDDRVLARRARCGT